MFFINFKGHWHCDQMSHGWERVGHSVTWHFGESINLRANLVLKCHKTSFLYGALFIFNITGLKLKLLFGRIKMSRRTGRGRAGGQCYQMSHGNMPVKKCHIFEWPLRKWNLWFLIKICWNWHSLFSWSTVSFSWAGASF